MTMTILFNYYKFQVFFSSFFSSPHFSKKDNKLQKRQTTKKGHHRHVIMSLEERLSFYIF